TMYTNGIRAGSRPHNIPTNNNFKFNIGGGGIFDTLAVNGNYFKGQIDEVAVFDKALSADRIAAQYFSAVNPLPVSITVQANLSGVTFTVDGTNYTSGRTFSWVSGSSHTISTTTSQSGGTGAQYVWNSWSDGGVVSHTVAPTSATNYTANFTTQYFLTMSAGAGGTVSPGSGWYNSAS